MNGSGNSLDRLAGHVYSRIMAVVTGLISIGMAGLAAVHWAFGGLEAAWIWIVGAVFFGIVARLCWSSRANMSDIDFSS